MVSWGGAGGHLRGDAPCHGGTWLTGALRSEQQTDPFKYVQFIVSYNSLQLLLLKKILEDSNFPFVHRTLSNENQIVL